MSDKFLSEEEARKARTEFRTRKCVKCGGLNGHHVYVGIYRHVDPVTKLCRECVSQEVK